jgi:glycosyltransferase involved in cell wall biosynthesis
VADVMVVLPTLGDRLGTLEETLESVRFQRSDVDLRLILVSPQAAFDARQLAEKYGAELVDDPSLGISRAINAALEARVNEKYYAWIGDDDIFRPGGLKLLIELLENSPEAVVSYGGCDYISADGQTLVVSKAGKFAQLLLPWGPDLIPHPGSVIRFDDLLAIGSFDEELKYAMDLDAFLKLRDRGPFVYTTKSVSGFRWHPESLTVANRHKSSIEAEKVKRSHTIPVLRPFSPLWLLPVRWVSAFLAGRVNRRAMRKLG